MDNYLTNIPIEVSKYGFCKTLLVRREIIHIKHIFSEIFITKKLDINKYLSDLNYDIFFYMEYMTNRIRKIHDFDRKYINDFDKIVKYDGKDFFPSIELMNGLNNVIILDFDGVITDEKFWKLYNLCIERYYTIICSGNPTITEDYFFKRNLPLPNKIYSLKGKISKICTIIDLHRKYDNVFYIDNEQSYLEYAWCFGINTFLWQQNKIKYFSMKTK